MVDYEESYETRAVSLWILNDEMLYSLARSCAGRLAPYHSLCERLRALGSEATPEGVRWDDPEIDHDAMDELIHGL